MSVLIWVVLWYSTGLIGVFFCSWFETKYEDATWTLPQVFQYAMVGPIVLLLAPIVIFQIWKKRDNKRLWK